MGQILLFQPKYKTAEDVHSISESKSKKDHTTGALRSQRINEEDFTFWGLVVFVPILFIFLTGKIRQLTSNTRGYEHFYLGVDVTFAAFTAAILNICDSATRIHKDPSAMGVFNGSLGRALPLVITFIILVFNMAIEQDGKNYAKDKSSMTPKETQKMHRTQMFVSNGLGILAFLAAAYFLRY